jgi:hypothetical protein
MPIHDWSLVPAGIFHAFHVGWVSALSASLNNGLLPGSYYAMPELLGGVIAAPVIARLQRSADDSTDADEIPAVIAQMLQPPPFAPTAETDLEFYRRKQNLIVIRSVSGDRMIAVVEIVSPANKQPGGAFRHFVQQATSLLLNEIHLVMVDLLPPTDRAPCGTHSAIWDEVEGERYEGPASKPLAVTSYEAAIGIRAFVQHMAVGEAIPTSPLFLSRDGCVMVRLDETYQKAFNGMPRLWQRKLGSTD